MLFVDQKTAAAWASHAAGHFNLVIPLAAKTRFWPLIVGGKVCYGGAEAIGATHEQKMNDADLSWAPELISRSSWLCRISFEGGLLVLRIRFSRQLRSPTGTGK